MITDTTPSRVIAGVWGRISRLHVVSLITLLGGRAKRATSTVGVDRDGVSSG
jgi:hypothetical protein